MNGGNQKYLVYAGRVQWKTIYGDIFKTYHNCYSLTCRAPSWSMISSKFLESRECSKIKQPEIARVLWLAAVPVCQAKFNRPFCYCYMNTLHPE